jgi:hypothetical protein
MYWLMAGLFVVGAVCGATVRLMAFVVVLLGATAVAVAACAERAWGIAVLTAVIAVVVLQVGYAGGFVLRAALRARQASQPSRGKHEPPIPAPLGEKRQ